MASNRSHARGVVLALQLLVASHAGAAMLQPSGIPMPITCGVSIKVTDALDGQTLELEPGDAILAAACPGNGVAIRNGGRGSTDRSFTLDCKGAGTIQGSSVGTGIRIRGPGITIVNCTVDGFRTGVTAHGDGEVVQDTIARNCARTGFDIRDPLRPTSDNFTGTIISSDVATDNAGFGFTLKGNGFTLDGDGDVFVTSLAYRNGLGGFYLKGRENTISGCDASNNSGPGFSVVERSCCTLDYSFDSSRAIGNVGPGVVYFGRDDGSNCSGGTCYPGGFDLAGTAAGVFDNGVSCPPGTVPYPSESGGQICLATKPCGASELDRC